MDTNPTPLPVASSGKLPEKYIRTFAKDMEIFKKGGTPGLSPLKESPSGTSERIVLPPKEAITPPPVEPLIPEPLLPMKPVVVVPAPLPPPVPKVTPIPPPVPEVTPLPPPVELPGAQPLKTYSEDFRERMSETHASTATILAAEQDAAPLISQAVPEKSGEQRRNLWYVITTVFLFLLGSVGVYVAYAHYLTKTAPVLIAPVASTPIFVDSRATVSGTGSVLMQAIEQSVAQPLTPNSIRLLSFDASATTSTDVFSALDLHAPGILLRNIDVPGSMAGVINTSNGQSPFFILSVGSYTTTFSGMLSWEPTMQTYLGTLFPLYSMMSTASSTATTTRAVPTNTTASTSTTNGGFRDEVVSNHDVRIYRDALGRSILLYGYWNQTTLVIARDPVAFTEILARLATSHS